MTAIETDGIEGVEPFAVSKHAVGDELHPVSRRLSAIGLHEACITHHAVEVNR
jgi:hypothetical protein